MAVDLIMHSFTLEQQDIFYDQLQLNPAAALSFAPVRVISQEYDNIDSYQIDLQKLLVKHWEEVLGYSPVGIEDNFFEVGGHSLTAAALAIKLRIQFAFEIPLVELLSAPTISMVSELIENRLWAIEQEVVASQGEVLEL